MPDYAGINDLLLRPASFKTYARGKIGFVDRFGGRHFLKLDTNGGDITQGELDALRNAVGDASNAGVFYDGVEKWNETAVADARAVNDTLGTVSTVAVFVFEREDNNDLKEYIEVPAPRIDILIRGEDEYFVNDQSAKAQAIINAATNGYNASIPDGEPNYVYRRAYLSDRKRQKIGGKEVPNVTETFPVI